MISLTPGAFAGYMILGFILGLLTTTFFFSGNDIVERSGVLLIVMLSWGIAIPILCITLFLVGAIRSADYLKVKLTPYFTKQE